MREIRTYGLRWQEMETDEMTRLRGTLSRKGSKQPGLTRSVLTPRHFLTLPFLRSVERGELLTTASRLRRQYRFTMPVRLRLASRLAKAKPLLAVLSLF